MAGGNQGEDGKSSGKSTSEEESENGEFSDRPFPEREDGRTPSPPPSDEENIAGILHRLAKSQERAEGSAHDRKVREAFLDFPNFDPERAEFDIVE